MKENNYFSRKIDHELLLWTKEENRKVLLLRGARQVGKSSAVRNLSKSFKYYVEINFDDADEQVKELFTPGVSPQEICMKLSALTLTPIIPNETLLFLDEIQSCVPAISKLRYFHEQYPELHVIAAGSLLEFALEELPSFGVGRIRSLFMYPFSFEEFLIASGKQMWVDVIREANPENPVFESLHTQLVNQLQSFYLIGGMPAVVSEFVKNQDFLKCQNVLNDILVSFRNDFAKYKKRVPATRINEVFESVAKQAEGKFVYERAAVQASNRQIKDALELLIMAGLVYPVTHTAANGIPLGAEINPKMQRMFLFDTGIFQRILNLNMADILIFNNLKTVNRGALAEIFVALELIKVSSCYSPVNLYFWQREKSQSTAQIDFIVQKQDKIIPIEVKAGTQGAMQSLRLFMKEKGITKGVRTSLENFAQYENIDVYPIYAISNINL
ncbi:MAG: AAA family ATPase [Bacteroidetes bacterium]|nr:AAA family ATPase [Bacteroidota bacterium]MCL1969543.1 AAA family ATPase [Bacteroidota bacterium]